MAVTLLFVDTGLPPEEREAALGRETNVFPMKEPDLLAGYGQEIGLYWLSLEQIIALAGGEERLNLEWLRESPAEIPAPEPQTRSVGEKEELGPLGQALLRALGKPPAS